MTNPRIVLIPGLSRCGTSWVTKWLGENADVSVHNESYFAAAMYNMLELCGTHQSMRRAEALDFMRAIYAEAARGRSVLIEKSPGSIIYKGALIGEWFLDLFPDAHILLFYRDGKQYAHSYLNVPWAHERQPNIERVVEEWIHVADYLAEGPKHPNILLVRYEDLLQHPTEQGRRIAEFVGISPSAPLVPWLTPVNTKHTSFDKDRWRELLPEYENLLRSMNPFLERLGYERVS